MGWTEVLSEPTLGGRVGDGCHFLRRRGILPRSHVQQLRTIEPCGRTDHRRVRVRRMIRSSRLCLFTLLLEPRLLACFVPAMASHHHIWEGAERGGTNVSVVHSEHMPFRAQGKDKSGSQHAARNATKQRAGETTSTRHPHAKAEGKLTTQL
jgi:hypothetical protein